MADRPILFSGPMIRALLDGRKTQTRRVIEPFEFPPLVDGPPKAVPPELIVVKVPARLGGWMQGPTFRPHFAVGDRLWAREAHAIFGAHGQHRDDGQRWGPWGGLPTQLSADRTQIAYFREGFDRSQPRWRPSIHMPRWASRLTLIVTAVRVERLRDIVAADAKAEGVEPAVDQPNDLPSYRLGYRDLWDSLNAKRGFGWDANPWVAATTFTVHHQNIDALNAQGSS